MLYQINGADNGLYSVLGIPNTSHCIVYRIMYDVLVITNGSFRLLSFFIVIIIIIIVIATMIIIVTLSSATAAWS